MTDANKPKKTHLGRGLESLLGPIITELPKEITDQPSANKFPPDNDLQSSVRTIPIALLRPNPYQPRTNWDQQDLAQLAESIKTTGLLQPILARNIGNEYHIIAGERRVRAAELAGLMEITVIVRQATDEQMLELALIENIHRKDLNPLERAQAYQNFINTFNLTQAQAAQRLGEDRSVVANYLRLLELPQEIKQMLTDGTLSMGHARAILSLPNDDLKRKLANRALAGRLSVREVERIVRIYLEGPKQEKGKENLKAPHIIDLERKLRDALGTKVFIEPRKNGNKGRIIIEYYSIDDFDRLTEKIGIDKNEDVL